MQKSVSGRDRPAPDRTGARNALLMRMTSISLVVLVPFALLTVLSLAGRDQATVQLALGRPWVAGAVALLVLIGVWHMWLGMREIIEDYLRAGSLRVTLALNTIFSLLVAAACLYAVARLALGI